MNRHRDIGALAIALAGLLASPMVFARQPEQAVAAPAAAAGMHRVQSSSADRRFRDKALARLDLQSGRFADAYHRLRPLVAASRDDEELLALLALAALRIGSHAEAMVIYQHLADVEPAVGRWRIGLALAREQLGLDASDALREALALSSASGIRDLLEAKLAVESPGVG